MKSDISQNVDKSTEQLPLYNVKSMNYSDSKLQILKLVLIGVIAIAIPVLFILQHKKASQEKQENENYKYQISDLKAELSYKNKLIDLIAYKVISMDTLRDTIYVNDTVMAHKLIYTRNDSMIFISGQLGSTYYSNGARYSTLNELTYYVIPLDSQINSFIHKQKSNYYYTYHPVEYKIKIPQTQNDIWRTFLGVHFY